MALPDAPELVDEATAVEEQVVRLVRPAANGLNVELGAAVLAEPLLKRDELIVVVGQPLVSKRLHGIC